MLVEPGEQLGGETERRHGVWWLRGDDRDSGKRPGDLRTAGVMRPELFERSASRQPIRLHDLRATFVTIALANGKTEQWVTDRTGHKSSQMLALCTRQARTWGELGLGTLGPLDELLPEVRESIPDGTRSPLRRSPTLPSFGHRLGIDPSHPGELNPRPTVCETVLGTRLSQEKNRAIASSEAGHCASFVPTPNPRKTRRGNERSIRAQSPVSF